MRGDADTVDSGDTCYAGLEEAKGPEIENTSASTKANYVSADVWGTSNMPTYTGVRLRGIHGCRRKHPSMSTEITCTTRGRTEHLERETTGMVADWRFKMASLERGERGTAMTTMVMVTIIIIMSDKSSAQDRLIQGFMYENNEFDGHE